MIINVCGFGWSGSGAVLDLLREYEGVGFPTKNDWEFNFIWAPDGLYDLEMKLNKKHCRIFDSDLAIKRFLSIAKEYGDKRGIFQYDKVFKESFYKQCEDYINTLIQFRLKALTFSHSLHPSLGDRIINQYNRWLEILLFNSISRKIKANNLYSKLYCKNYKEMQVSYNPDNFKEETQKFIESLLKQIRRESDKILVLNQSVPPDDPYLFDHYFREDHKTIIVRRDPRDTFLIINKLKGISRPVPTNINDFITFYKKTIFETILPDTDSVMSLQFEDLVYDYENTVKKIEQFVGVNSHKEKFNFFDPRKSMNNTQLIRLYPEFISEIKIIERELHDSLYPFNLHGFVRTTNEIF